MHHQITPGAVVLTVDQIELTVRALEGNVAVLEAADGSFFGYRHVSSLTPVPQPGEPTSDELAGMAWYNSQTEDTLRFWHAIAGSAAPVDAWIAYRDTAGTVCPPPATQAAPVPGLAAAAGAGQGAGTLHPHDDEVCPRCGDHDVYVRQVVDGTASMRCGECWHLWERCA